MVSINSDFRNPDWSMFRPSVFKCKDCGKTQYLASFVMDRILNGFRASISRHYKGLCLDCVKRCQAAFREQMRWYTFGQDKMWERATGCGIMYFQSTSDDKIRRLPGNIALPEEPTSVAMAYPVKGRTKLIIADEVDEYCND